MKLIDRLSIKYRRQIRKYNSPSLNCSAVNNRVYFSADDLQNISSLQGALKLIRNDKKILRESDKKMGWSLNCSNWCKEKYLRHLQSDFYERVGNADEVRDLLQRCRNELNKILSKYKGGFDYYTLQKFYSRKIEEYILPSMNLMPKVHKLSAPASPSNAKELKGRPIITAHSWCTVEASKFLQSKLRGITHSFKKYLESKGVNCTILGDSKELVDVIKQTKIDYDNSCSIHSWVVLNIVTKCVNPDLTVATLYPVN